MWLPNALLYGVPYDVFWRLNPKKLKPYQEKQRLQNQEKKDTLDFLAWRTGIYVLEAIATAFGNRGQSYPEKPYGLQDDVVENNGQVMTDGEKFKLFVIEHNKNLKKHKKS